MWTWGFPGSEAGFRRPAVVVTAQRLLAGTPSVVHVVPLTTTLRGFASEVPIPTSGDNDLDTESCAQAHQIRTVSAVRVHGVRGNVGAVALSQVRQAIAETIDCTL